jgi:ribosome biogenesis GTPase A
MNADLDRVVQWYPGHMVRAMRRIGEYLKLINVVIEVVDARVPMSGRNPMLDTLIGARKRLVVLNREDLAEASLTKRWLAVIEATGVAAVSTNGREQPSVRRAGFVVTELAKGVRGMARALVLGVPNSGKSSIINGLLRRAAARTEDRAGVTRQLQWFRMADGVELMDTPGILVPKIATPDAQWKLAIVGAVPRERYNPEEIALQFHAWLSARSGGRTRVPDLPAFAKARGFVRRGGDFDYHNAAQSYITAFNEGTFGRFTLEDPPEPAEHDDQTA